MIAGFKLKVFWLQKLCCSPVYHTDTGFFLWPRKELINLVRVFRADFVDSK